MQENNRSNLIADGLATVEQGEAFLSIGRSKLYQLMDAGQLSYVKIGKARRIPWKAIKALAEQSLVGSGS